MQRVRVSNLLFYFNQFNPIILIRAAIVDDHFATRDGYCNLLRKVEYVAQVHAFATAREMLDEMKRKPFDLVLMDIELGGENGLDVCRRIKLNQKNLKVLVISSYHSE